MEEYTIEEFWVPRLGYQTESIATSLVEGWSFQESGLGTFQEAPLTLSTEEFGDEAKPLQSNIILVSAPGAVGKTTLARQIAFTTGSVYIDLAKADPVGGNSLSGGLVKSGIYAHWQDGNVTAMIDGLDEAALKTTKEGFESFLSDVAILSESRTMPTILFGRTGTVQDAWLVLSELCSAAVPVLEIGYYDHETSIEFAQATIQAAYPDRQHPSVDREALDLLLTRLRSQTASDGNRFAGYAPVLQAVAERVGQEPNPSRLLANMQQDIQIPITLRSVVSAILEREQGKLSGISFEDPTLVEILYKPEEQLARLVARGYQVPPPKLPQMTPEDADTYLTKVESWVAEHPFLDGAAGTSSAVFEAVITTKALKSVNAAQKALARELSRGDAANPFLYVFYMDDGDGEKAIIPEEHIGVIYGSIRASLAYGESASLSVDEAEPEDQNGELWTQVDVELNRRDSGGPTTLEFETGPLGPICLGSHVRDVAVNTPKAKVEIGQGNEIVIVAPVNISCGELSIVAERMIVENPAGHEASVVMLAADACDGGRLSSVPVVRSNVKLLASWPGVENYPWHGFAVELDGVDIEDSRIDEVLRRFRKFVISFRAGGRGSLGRSKHKMESERMTKGTGKAVLELMVREGLVSQDSSMYYLDAQRLADLTDSTYADYVSRRFGSKAIKFAEKVLREIDD